MTGVLSKQTPQEEVVESELGGWEEPDNALVVVPEGNNEESRPLDEPIERLTK